MFSAESDVDSMSSGHRDIDVWLHTRAKTLRKAQVSLESARQAMIRAQKSYGTPHVYAVDDLVKISTRALPLRLESTQKPKLLPKYIGPFTVVSVSDKVVQVKLPESYKQVHDKFNVVYVRPWLSSDRDLDIGYPAVAPHPALNPVVQILDRKRFGRAPKYLDSYLDIPCQYLVVPKDGSTRWVSNSQLTESEDVQLIKTFEKKYPRSEELPCEPVKAYNSSKAQGRPDDASDDELDIAWHDAVDQHYADLMDS
jgi:hypothetical protein